jgi:hypothetical protein
MLWIYLHILHRICFSVKSYLLGIRLNLSWAKNTLCSRQCLSACCVWGTKLHIVPTGVLNFHCRGSLLPRGTEHARPGMTSVEEWRTRQQWPRITSAQQWPKRCKVKNAFILSLFEKVGVCLPLQACGHSGEVKQPHARCCRFETWSREVCCSLYGVCKSVRNCVCE